MIILPTIELWEGRCISQRRGDLDNVEIWHVDPLRAAEGFAAAGATGMHITDFDAIAGDTRNQALIGEIIRHAELSVQLYCGITTREQVEHRLEAGAARVVLGRAAAYDPHMVKAAAKYHPDQIVLGMEMSGGRLWLHGWSEPCAFTPEAFLDAFAPDPLAGILITDVDNDMGRTDGSLGTISHLAAHSRAPVIASGVVHEPDDLARLKYVPNVAGALIGRALFNHAIDLGEALALAAAPVGETAGFV